MEWNGIGSVSVASVINESPSESGPMQDDVRAPETTGITQA